MKNSYLILLIFPLFFSCQPQEEENFKIELRWLNSFIGITDYIQDSAINGDELHIITTKDFYRIKDNTILEKRPLTQHIYNNRNGAIIGHQLAFRTLNFDSVFYLEFFPLKEGGKSYLYDIRDIGIDRVFTANFSAGIFQPGIFNSKDQFLLVAYNYPEQQELIIEFDIHYNENSNIIESVEVINMENVTPQSSFGITRIDILQVDKEVFYFGASGNNIYRYENHIIQHSSDFRLKSIFRDEDALFATTSNRAILTSLDNGVTWEETGQTLEQGNAMKKVGEYLIESRENQPFQIGQSFDSMKPFNNEDLGDNFLTVSMIEFYNNQYYIGTNNKIYSRNSLE